MKAFPSDSFSREAGRGSGVIFRMSTNILNIFIYIYLLTSKSRRFHMCQICGFIAVASVAIATVFNNLLWSCSFLWLSQMYDLFRCIKSLYFPLDSEGLIWFEVSQHLLSLKRKSHQTLLSGRDPSVWGSLIWTAKTNLRAVSLWRAWYTLKWLCCCLTSILYCLIKSSCVLQGHVVVEVFVIEQNKSCYQLVTDYKHHEKTFLVSQWKPSLQTSKPEEEN